jgi:hypothetical protein
VTFTNLVVNQGYVQTPAGDPTPYISEIIVNPPLVSGGSGQLTILGWSFGTVAGQVTFCDTPAEPPPAYSVCNDPTTGLTYSNTQWNSNQIVATINASTSTAPGSYDVQVTSSGTSLATGFQSAPGSAGASSLQTTGVPVQAAPNCTVQNQIIQEYVTYNVIDMTHGNAPWQPFCPWFTQTAHSLYYTFNQLGNIGKQPYTWALVKKPLATPQSSGYGLDDWTALLSSAGWGSMQTTASAYRTRSTTSNAVTPRTSARADATNSGTRSISKTSVRLRTSTT